jgi:hypothetical protein
MAAVTAVISAGVALAGLGMSVAQAAKADKAKKAASAAASKAASDMKNIKEVNPYTETQVPTVGFDLMRDQINRQGASALQSAQGAGAEGVIGASGQIMQGLSAAGLDTAREQANLEYERNMNQAQAGLEIGGRKAIRESEMYQNQLTGAQNAAAAAQNAKVAAITGAVKSAGLVASSLTSKEAYKQQKDRDKKNKEGDFGDPGKSTEESDNMAYLSAYGFGGLG